MIRYLILFLLLCTSTVFSQDTIPRYWIGFTDKINSNYTLNNPLGYLSERAILRREKQAILIDSLDLPVSQLYIQSVLAAGDFELWAISKWLNGQESISNGIAFTFWCKTSKPEPEIKVIHKKTMFPALKAKWKHT